MIWKYLVVFPLSLTTLVMSADQDQSNSLGYSACRSIAGEYQFMGVIDAKEAISFTQALQRPSRRGVAWVRIVEGAVLGEFGVWTYGDSGQVIGEPIRLAGRCMRGKWEENNSYVGNSDGTFVKGNRTWLYYLDADGSLKVDYSGTSTMQYFPGITASPKSYSASARFARRN